jgi:hypothetical protein
MSFGGGATERTNQCLLPTIIKLIHTKIIPSIYMIPSRALGFPSVFLDQYETLFPDAERTF